MSFVDKTYKLWCNNWSNFFFQIWMPFLKYMVKINLSLANKYNKWIKQSEWVLA